MKRIEDFFISFITKQLYKDVLIIIKRYNKKLDYLSMTSKQLGGQYFYSVHTRRFGS